MFLKIKEFGGISFGCISFGGISFGGISFGGISFLSEDNIAPLATIVVVTSLITLYYYLKISYSRFLILNTELCNI
jgi:hypothetical protein